MATAERLLTADEFLAIPGETRYTQLIGGRIVVDDPTGLHQIAAGNVYGALHVWIRSEMGFGRVLLPQTLPMAERHVFSPDLLWYADPDRHDLTRGRQYELPDLVVRSARRRRGATTSGSSRRSTRRVESLSCGTWTRWARPCSYIAAPLPERASTTLPSSSFLGRRSPRPPSPASRSLSMRSSHRSDAADDRGQLRRTPTFFRKGSKRLLLQPGIPALKPRR